MSSKNNINADCGTGCGTGPIRVKLPERKEALYRLEQQQMQAAKRYRGWAVNYMRAALAADRICVPMSGAQRLVLSAGDILRLNYNDLFEFLGAAENVLQGAASKEIPAPVAAVGGAPTVVALTTRSAGLIVRISDSTLNADYRPVPLQISGTGLSTYTATLYPCSEKADAVLFGVSNNAGQAALIAATNVTLTIAADRIRAGALVAVESLTLRDIK